MNYKHILKKYGLRNALSAGMLMTSHCAYN